MIDMAARALLALGCFVGVGAALMLLGTAGGTPERLVSWIALVLGLAAIVASATVLRIRIVRRLRESDPSDPDDEDVIHTKEES
ncbi:hypothetical protein [Brachybacterium hainanense]|uniref:Uncharacterized protein n=1 Tax=Brachybacterium hainanense TaxID=1541174 RepID=A0ABV6R6Q6_9MICO